MELTLARKVESGAKWSRPTPPPQDPNGDRLEPSRLLTEMASQSVHFFRSTMFFGNLKEVPLDKAIERLEGGGSLMWARSEPEAAQVQLGLETLDYSRETNSWARDRGWTDRRLELKSEDALRLACFHATGDPSTLDPQRKDLAQRVEALRQLGFELSREEEIALLHAAQGTVFSTLGEPKPAQLKDSQGQLYPLRRVEDLALVEHYEAGLGPAPENPLLEKFQKLYDSGLRFEGYATPVRAYLNLAEGENRFQSFLPKIVDEHGCGLDIDSRIRGPVMLDAFSTYGFAAVRQAWHKVQDSTTNAREYPMAPYDAIGGLLTEAVRLQATPAEFEAAQDVVADALSNYFQSWDPGVAYRRGYPDGPLEQRVAGLVYRTVARARGQE